MYNKFPVLLGERCQICHATSCIRSLELRYRQFSFLRVFVVKCYLPSVFTCEIVLANHVGL